MVSSRSRAGSGLPAAAGSVSRRASDRPARDKTIVVFDCGGTVRTPRLVADPGLSPLDLTVAPNGHLVVSSEHPFGAPDAVSSIREYERLSERLVRVFVPDSSLWFRRPPIATVSLQRCRPARARPQPTRLSGGAAGETEDPRPSSAAACPAVRGRPRRPALPGAAPDCIAPVGHSEGGEMTGVCNRRHGVFRVRDALASRIAS